MVFFHDNATPDVVKLVREILEAFGLDVLLHLPYSPNAAPSDYYFFLLMQRSISEHHFIFFKILENFSVI